MAIYGHAGVAAACLDLQDRAGADVNLLLTAAWLADAGRTWQRSEIAELVQLSADWRERCVLPLRAVRRYLAQQPEINELYQQAKALELAAERWQLELIETWWTARPPVVADRHADRLRLNLDRYLETLAAAGGIADGAALAAALTRTTQA